MLNNRYTQLIEPCDFFSAVSARLIPSLRKVTTLTAVVLILSGIISRPALSADTFNAWEVDTQRPAGDLLEQGRWNLVAIWALDCVICEKQKPTLSKFHTSHSTLNVVGVSIDGKSNLKQVRQRLKEKPVSFENYLVEFPTFNLEYQARYKARFIGTPTYILYGPKGEVQGIQAGPIDFIKLDALLKSHTHAAPADGIYR